MAKTLYVANLQWSATEDTLTAAFEEHAPVISARIVTERETGRSRGFGFVEVEDKDANNLIALMNGKDLGGRNIIVSEARQKPAPDGRQAEKAS
ncbi:MAG: RNA-binding protein [Candidatus Saganbacteria bacterium]|nr:RNA-binding protein [Candidatus Saganbacteria bacterium]